MVGQGKTPGRLELGARHFPRSTDNGKARRQQYEHEAHAWPQPSFRRWRRRWRIGGAIRHHSGGGVPLNRNHVFDSNGPEIRIRGTAQQLFEKYLQLGRDATSSGDRVTAEAFFQHAEHYFRILNAMNQAQQQGQPNGQGGQQQLRRATSAGITSKARGSKATTRDRARPNLKTPSSGPDQRTPGLGDQPEPREIPIAAAPPES